MDSLKVLRELTQDLDQGKKIKVGNMAVSDGLFIYYNYISDERVYNSPTPSHAGEQLTNAKICSIC